MVSPSPPPIADITASPSFPRCWYLPPPSLGYVGGNFGRFLFSLMCLVQSSSTIASRSTSSGFSNIFPHSSRDARANNGVGATSKWKNIQKDPEFNHFLYSRSNIDLKVRLSPFICLHEFVSYVMAIFCRNSPVLTFDFGHRV